MRPRKTEVRLASTKSMRIGKKRGEERRKGEGCEKAEVLVRVYPAHVRAAIVTVRALSVEAVFEKSCRIRVGSM